MAKLTGIDERTRALFILTVSFLTFFIPSIFIAYLDSIGIATAEIHVSAPLVGIFQAIGFIALSALYVGLFSYLYPWYKKQPRRIAPTDGIVIVVVVLTVVYALTLRYQVINVPGYDNPVVSTIVLKPIILGLVGVTTWLFLEREDREKSTSSSINRGGTDSFDLVTLMQSITTKEREVECAFCGDRIHSNDEFYEHVDMDSESVAIERFCSALCVAAAEKKPTDTV